MKKIYGMIAAVALMTVTTACSLTSIKSVDGNGNSNVTITVDKNITIDIANDSSKDIIDKVNRKDGALYDYVSCMMYNVDENGEIFSKKSTVSLSNTDKRPDFSVYFTLDSGKTVDMDVAKLGYFNYVLRNFENSSCYGLSLFSGWNGSMSKVDKYLNDENSVLIDNWNGISLQVAVFKDGKIVPLETIMNEYGAEAEEIAKYDSLDDYYLATGKSHVGESIPKSFLKDMSYGEHSVESFALLCALYDWGSNYTEGNRTDFGLIRWSADFEELDVTIATSSDNYKLLSNAETR